ncbi:MAG: sugar phosphate isomerase/epimerase [Armatimonadetes bacterium]|nr:sugar phosphate isomerase/epimerase [Armatimonadota bacterium]CUU35782.1 Sugar phosphate isomerase/epimerase [Armatimonadetes bacterium DC]
MARPTIAWMPVRHLHAIVEGRMAVEAWLEQAPAFGLQAVEIYHGFLSEQNLPSVKRTLERLGLQVSQITCAPDFTNPDPAVRRREQEQMRQRVEWAQTLGANAVRTTAGMLHPELAEEDGIRYAVEEMVKLAEYAVPLGVYPCYENHYRDRRWDKPDFSFEVERFLKIFEQIEPTEVRVNFDFANPLMTGADPVALLKRVVHKVHHVHAGDRRMGEYQHCVLGEGQVPFRELLTILREHGYTGYLSVEDGQAEGDEGFRRSLAFLRHAIEAVWGG